MTYNNWDPKASYKVGERVQHTRLNEKGQAVGPVVVYEAICWNQGNDPSDDDASPDPAWRVVS